MKIRLLLFIFLFASFTFNHKEILAQAEEEWATIVPGIDYREWHLYDPYYVNVFVARMDRTASNLAIESSLGLGKISSGIETISNQFNRYNEALITWDWNMDGDDLNNWGARNKVIVAINGAYFDSNGVPLSGQVQSGWYARRFLDNENFSGIVFKRNGEIFIGGCVDHPVDKQVINFSNGNSIYIDNINTAHGQNDLIIYTPQFDAFTPSTTVAVEMVVDMTRPAFITLASDPAVGIVREIRQNSNSTPIPFDHVVLSAIGNKANQLLSYAQVGDEIEIAQKVKDLTHECQVYTNPKLWEGAYTAIHYGLHLLQNGQVVGYYDNPGAIVRAPRTAIAFNQHYVYFIVVDGRNPGVSYGMTIAELGYFSRDVLGAIEGVSLDGGGSSTMVVNGKVMNFPSDGVLNPYATTTSKTLYLPIVVGGVSNPVPPAPIPITERPVANGMMMVVVEPPEFSTKFAVGQTVKTTANVNLRQGPGTNYNKIIQINSNTSGTVINHPKGLNGIFATGYYWWRVNFNSKIGWMAESYLSTP